MQKVKSKIKNHALYVKVKLPKNSQINEYEVSVLEKNLIQYLMKYNCIKRNSVEYAGLKGITLSEFLQQPISKKDFLFLIGQMIEVLNQINHYHLKSGNIIWHSDSIFINQNTKEIQMIYLPCDNTEENDRIIQFFDSLLYSVIPEKNHSTEYLTMFSFFIKSQKTFHPKAFEEYINSEDSSVMKALKKYRTGLSNYSSTPPEVLPIDEGTELLDEKTELLTKDGQRELHYSEETSLLDENPYDLSYQNQNSGGFEETGLLTEETNSNSGNPFMEETGLLLENQDSFIPEQGTELLIEDQFGQKGFSDYASVSSNEMPPAFSQALQSNSSYHHLDSDDGSMLTGLLTPEDDGFNQTDHKDAGICFNEQKEISFPKLYRVRTDEWVLINKPVFRLGKEKSYVDYFVNNNSAVSRSHADIITRDGACFIKDLNSKNRTYINNYPIPVLTEVALENGSRLKLGNEEFVFQNEG